MKNKCSIGLLVVVVTLMAVSALLVFGQEAKSVPEHAKKAFVVVNGSEPIKIDIHDLKDGESRTIKEGNKEIVITRKGDKFLVQCDGTKGESKSITLTSGEQVGGKMLIVRSHKEGDKEHKVLIQKTIEVEGEEGLGTIFVTDDEVDGKDNETVRIVSTGDKSCEKHLVVTTAKAGEPEMHMCGSSDSLAFRCKEDDTIVTVLKDKLKAEAMNCPVCGKAMDKLDGTGVKVVRVVTTATDDKNK